MQYEPSEEEYYLPLIRQLISKDLSEPYSIYVYRYFLYQWGDLCYTVRSLLSTPSHTIFAYSYHVPRPSTPRAKSSSA
jgi:hypothetical protein